MIAQAIHSARHELAKGRPPPRRCPADFDIIFVELGRLDCEPWYRASRRTVNRWLDERGKQRLIDLRAAFIRHQRAMLWAAGHRLIVPVRQIDAPIDVELVRMAAHYLRQSRNGGWLVAPHEFGGWWVGTNRGSSAELVATAVRKGFDVVQANLQIMAERGVG